MIFYTSIDDIRNVFYEFFDGNTENAIWSLYNGRGKAVKPSGKAVYAGLIYNQEKDISLDESWGILSQQLSRFHRGYAHLYLGGDEKYISVPISFGTDGQQNASIGNMGLPYNVLTAIEKERKIWELENRLERLLEASESRSSFVERIGEKLMESEQLPLILNGVIGLLTRLSGQPMPQQALPAIQGTDDEQESGENDIFSFESQIKGNFQSTGEMRMYLRKMAQLINADPNGMKAVIEQAHKQVIG